MENLKIEIYTDGACSGNPGKGGYGVVLLYGKHRKELSGGYQLTTSNRMELQAAIKALETLKKACPVKMYSDSQYLVNSMTKGWVENWKAKNWRKSDKDKVKNVDLWEKLLELCKKHQVEFQWIKGHNGEGENERCDFLAKSALQAEVLEKDEGYQNEPDLLLFNEK